MQYREIRRKYGNACDFKRFGGRNKNVKYQLNWSFNVRDRKKRRSKMCEIILVENVLKFVNYDI